ncbi:hypothetical protein FIV42_18645 [Persicimonas caeni]|jgi:hypothetical protein|uniref:Uncharacterized protein n=1 Tax=Persicimonas caeni TaxID=2292766 RepID=A0A4Y6PWH2_PERCE|nr:hypothetical protein [Persicimonas caeni]QDG52684.1 hypothetical protein FIV42_18645 [Persicimonas caeni]QED33906.1 hypothetical protein FRD00_18640 [Persicimonas caeni]
MASGPDLKTPVSDLVLATREVAQWVGRNKAKFEGVVAADFGGADAGRAAAALLDGQEAEFQTERREDVAWTNEKNALVSRVGPLADVARSGVRLAYFEDENLDDVLKDFSTAHASDIRTLPRARRALQILEAGLTRHADELRGSMGHFDRVLEECKQLRERSIELSDAYGEETSETREAARERRTARVQCLEFIERVELAARMAQLDHPELLVELDAIYAEFLPQPEPSPAGGDQPEPTEA